MKSFLAAIDCGTTAVKSAVVGLRGEIKGLAGVPTPCVSYPDGRIESDPQAMVAACFSALRLALKKSGVPPRHIEGLSLTNQRATVLGIDDHGRELGHAISWQDMRGAACIKAFRRRLSDKTYYSITGLPNNAVFTLAKILWIKKHDPDRFRAPSARKWSNATADASGWNPSWEKVQVSISVFRNDEDGE